MIQASKKSNSSDSSEESSDEESEDEEPLKTPKKVFLSSRYMHEHICALCLNGNYVTLCSLIGYYSYLLNSSHTAILEHMCERWPDDQ